ncbi:MAG: hypothetical protein D6712_04805 [Chloroflexi bacterium]|nr:MAG: hypothetical protein D6712_04805 [Chloroflexota bacterium]
MKYFRYLPVLFIIFMLGYGVTAQEPLGVTVNCDNGRTITNGVPITVVQMRTGFTYTATAMGINGFDPVLAVVDANGNGLCTDDTPSIASYTASLPTTGNIAGSATNAQITFSNNSGQPFADVTIVVGGYEDQGGEFIVLLEGMALTQADNIGDPFTIQITPGMAQSGVPLTVYQISVTNAFDPLIATVDSEYNFIQLDDGSYVACDDAGNANACFGQSSNLSSSYITRTQNRQLPGGPLDAMLSFPLSPEFAGQHINFLMRSSSMETFGDYVVVFHAGIASQQPASPPVQPTTPPVQQSTPAPLPGGGATGEVSGNVEVVDAWATLTCDDGRVFPNVTTFIVRDTAPGSNFLVTALGVNGFDPYLATMDADGTVHCVDNSPDAATYNASLPSTGTVTGSPANAQAVMSNNTDQTSSLIFFVASANNQPGEVVIFLEGLELTAQDTNGNTVAYQISPSLSGSGVDFSVYQISLTNEFDPLIAVVDSEGNFVQDSSGNYFACDNAGDSSMCWGNNADLSTSYIARDANAQLAGGPLDAMLTLGAPESLIGTVVNLQMRSSSMATTGGYVVVFHFGLNPQAAGTGAPATGGDGGGGSDGKGGF